MIRLFPVLITMVCTLLAASLAPVNAEPAASGESGAQASARELPDDTIAMVGDQPITFNQIEIMINSSAMIGMNIPPPGTEERNQVRISLLDKIVSAELIYLDALDQGLDKNPVYQYELEQAAEANLAKIYQKKYLIGDIPVSDEAIMDYYENNIVEGTPFTKDLGVAIEAKLRKQEYTRRNAELRARLREGIQVTIDEARVDPGDDADRQDGDVLATLGDESLTWGDVKGPLTFNRTSTRAQRLDALNQFIDQRIMVNKARAAGVEQDPVYRERINEYRKVRLVSMHRDRLLEEMAPTDDEIRAYYEKHRDEISKKEARRIQMVVMQVKEDAERVKQEIESGKMTFFEAARDFSIDPNAKLTLGEMGWVEKGSGFPELDALAFSLQLNELGGPVESPAGWHLVKVLEIREAAHTNISQADTWRITRRMLIKERMDDYTANLRKNKYPVQVYNDVFNRILENELKPDRGGAEETQQDAPG